MQQYIKNFIKRTLADNSELTMSELTDDINIKDSIDSLEWLDFIFEINLEFQIKLPGEEISPDITIKSLGELIEAEIKKKSN